jgi:hypothetical protein
MAQAVGREDFQVRRVGILPQQPLDAAGGQTPPLSHEDRGPATRMRRVAQDHEGASSLRIERELAMFRALRPRVGRG